MNTNGTQTILKRIILSRSLAFCFLFFHAASKADFTAASLNSGVNNKSGFVFGTILENDKSLHICSVNFHRHCGMTKKRDGILQRATTAESLNEPCVRTKTRFVVVKRKR